MGDSDGAERAINDGLSFCDPNQFWLLYLKAQFLFRIRGNVEQAGRELLRVEGILYDKSSTLELDFLNVPSCLRWSVMVEQGTARTNLKMVLV